MHHSNLPVQISSRAGLVPVGEGLNRPILDAQLSTATFAFLSMSCKASHLLQGRIRPLPTLPEDDSKALRIKDTRMRRSRCRLHDYM